MSTLGQKSEFVELDINNRRMLEQALEGKRFYLFELRLGGHGL